MSSKTTLMTDVYRAASACPVVTSATILPNGDGRYLIESYRQQSDLEREEHVTFIKSSSFCVGDSKIEIGTHFPPRETRGLLLSRYSRCGRKKAVIREVENTENERVQYLEIWDEFKKIININLKECDVHGKVHNTSPFGCLTWSDDGKKIAYIAEAKIPKSHSFFKSKRKKEDGLHASDFQPGKELSSSEKVECLHGKEHMNFEKEESLHSSNFQSDSKQIDGKKEECLHASGFQPGNKNIDFKIKEACLHSEDCIPGSEHIYRETWGEQLVECHRPTLCTVDIGGMEVETYTDLIPGNLSVGQAEWCHNNEAIIFLAWEHEPYRPGLRGFLSHKSALYLLNPTSKTCVKLTSGETAIFCFRIHPKLDQIVYFENEADGPHQNSARIFALDIAERPPEGGIEPRLILDEVMHAENVGDFPGLFIFDPQLHIWSENGDFIFLSTAWRATLSVIAVNIRTGDVKRLTHEGVATILDVKDDIIAIEHSTPSSPPQTQLGKFFNGDIVWVTVERPCGEFSKIRWSVHSFTPEFKNDNFPAVDCDYVLFQPPEGTVGIGRSSLVVNPHGGPHNNSCACFDPKIVGLCMLGYTVVQVNYRGSQGYGKDGIHSLPGNIGKQDVKDVHQVAVKIREELRMTRVFVTGVSHGGFLTLHLIAQYPDFYSAAVIKNPVVDLVSTLDTVDMPAWVYCEAGVGQYTPTSLPTADTYRTLLEKSPIAHINAAKAPCLMMVGSEDQRCHPTQGKAWAKMYRAFGKICKVLEYKGSNHLLIKADVAADSFVNMVQWFEEHKGSLEH